MKWSHVSSSVFTVQGMHVYLFVQCHVVSPLVHMLNMMLSFSRDANLPTRARVFEPCEPRRTYRDGCRACL